jgi:glycogen synthase
MLAVATSLRPRVSVVICAYTVDRWDDVLSAIASARAQPEAPEVVVVVDHDDELYGRLRAARTGATVVRNPGPRGLSAARNAGVAVSSGAIVAFLDDDARAEPGWLGALTDPYADRSVAGTGGCIEPAWDAGRPRWFPVELDWVVGCSYLGLPQARADVRNVIGASMSFRRSALEAVGGFAGAMGRGRGLPVGGEETELCIRVRRAVPGARIVYEPRAVVHHRVRAARATPGYLVRRAWAEGVTKARVSRLAGAASGLATERRYVTRTLPAGVVRCVRDAAAHNDPWALARAGAIAAALGAAAAGFVAEAVGGWRPGTGAARGLRGRPTASRDADRPLRILQVTARYAPFVGGVEIHTAEVSRRLAARGHRVTVATTDPTGALPAHEVVDGVEIARVRAWPGDRDWYLAPGLFHLIGSRRWDVVHLQGVHTLVPPLGALAAILGGRRFVLTFHSGGHASVVRTRARGLQWRLLAPLLRRASALVAVSRFEAERFSAALGVPRDEVEVIRNGAELPGLDALDELGPVSAPDERTGPLLLSLGRLERYKGHQRVIAAMPALRAARPGARLLVAGSGAYEPDLRRLVEDLDLADAVSIASVPRDELPATLLGASLVTLLSEYEAHPVAVMEALAARRPVLVADTSGFRELAEEGLVRTVPLDAPPEAVAEAIVLELDRPAPATVPALPTWDDTTDALEALYRRVVAR